MHTGGAACTAEVQHAQQEVQHAQQEVQRSKAEPHAWPVSPNATVWSNAWTPCTPRDLRRRCLEMLAPCMQRIVLMCMRRTSMRVGWGSWKLPVRGMLAYNINMRVGCVYGTANPTQGQQRCTSMKVGACNALCVGHRACTLCATPLSAFRTGVCWVAGGAGRAHHGSMPHAHRGLDGCTLLGVVRG